MFKYTINTIVKLSLIFSILFVASCTTKIGKFTTISTNNVRGLEYLGKNRDEIVVVEGKSCSHRVYLTRVAVGAVTLGLGWFFPQFDLILGESEKDRLTSSVDEALKSAKSRGVFDADVLVNAVIKEKNIIVPLIYGYKCYVAEGDATASIIRTDGFLEKKTSSTHVSEKKNNTASDNKEKLSKSLEKVEASKLSE